MALTYPTDPYSSSDLVAGDYAADQALALDRAQGLVDLSRIMKWRNVVFWFTSQTAVPGASTWAETHSRYVKVPTSWQGENLIFTCEAYVSAGSGRYRIVDKTTTTYSTQTASFSNTGWVLKEAVTLAIGSDWGNTVREIGFEVWNDTGGATTGIRTSGGTYDYYRGYSEDDG